jgi:hypothetical protein
VVVVGEARRSWGRGFRGKGRRWRHEATDAAASSGGGGASPCT